MGASCLCGRCWSCACATGRGWPVRVSLPCGPFSTGALTAIVGRPNVGKSSLLNALLRTSRAIVTSIPGTTRDTLEETLNLQGVPLVLVDTAGITADAEDVVERLGIERSRAALAQADLALLVVDGSEPLTPADRDIAALLEDKPGLLVINKCDLPVVPAQSAPCAHLGADRRGPGHAGVGHRGKRILRSSARLRRTAGQQSTPQGCPATGL